MDPIKKLVDAKQRLATMLESEKHAAPAHVRDQWSAIIGQLDEAIDELRSTGSTTTNLEAELVRTTRQ